MSAAAVSEAKIVNPDNPRAGIALTPKELALLSLLRQNPGRCFSRPFLLHNVWGYREGTHSRTVDVHISKLRRKLGPEGGASIRTIFRAGYTWHP